jgi:hypothetical protein
VATIGGGADSFYEYMLKAHLLWPDAGYGDAFAEVMVVPVPKGPHGLGVILPDEQAAACAVLGVHGRRARLAARPMVRCQR